LHVELVPDSYITLAGLCPNLETLQLNLCGRIETDTMIKWGTAFKKLKSIELDGPFLVRVEGWKKFFKGIGSRLESFMIK
jgi:DNA repair protein RAD7